MLTYIFHLVLYTALGAGMGSLAATHGLLALRINLHNIPRADVEAFAARRPRLFQLFVWINPRSRPTSQTIDYIMGIKPRMALVWMALGSAFSGLGMYGLFREIQHESNPVRVLLGIGCMLLIPLSFWVTGYYGSRLRPSGSP